MLIICIIDSHVATIWIIIANAQLLVTLDAVLKIAYFRQMGEFFQF